MEYGEEKSGQQEQLHARTGKGAGRGKEEKGEAVTKHRRQDRWIAHGRAHLEDC